jgi:hypothetical protein
MPDFIWLYINLLKLINYRCELQLQTLPVVWVSMTKSDINLSAAI